MNRIIKKLQTAQNRYENAINDAIEEMEDKVDFEFLLTYQHSDSCFMVVYDIHNAPLDKCLDVIKEKGILTIEDYKKYVI